MDDLFAKIISRSREEKRYRSGKFNSKAIALANLDRANNRYNLAKHNIK
jgi:hypothetical protein